MSTTAKDRVDGPDEQDWQAWLLHYLPLVLLGVGTAVALGTAPATGAASPAWRLVAQLLVVAVTAAWLVWWCLIRPGWFLLGRRMAVYYVVRTALAFALTVLNPLFCLFAWIGFNDADDAFRGRGIWVGVGATAVTMAIGQSGGVPFGSAGHAALFVILIAVNFGLAYTLGRFWTQHAETSESRKVAITELERVNASLEEALARNAALQETVVAQARTTGVQEERQRLAGEIHDTIAQSLAAILAQLQAAAQDPAPGARIARATEMARTALAEARRSVMDLAPAPLSGSGLPEALERAVRTWTTDHPARADLVLTGDLRPLHPEVEATVLRVAQEALANVARHAAASRVGVTLTYDDAEVILDVRDDGAGFEAGADPAPSSFGLRGMRQRATRLAGVLDIETAPGSGTAVSLRLPALARGAA